MKHAESTGKPTEEALAAKRQRLMVKLVKFEAGSSIHLNESRPSENSTETAQAESLALAPNPHDVLLDNSELRYLHLGEALEKQLIDGFGAEEEDGEEEEEEEEEEELDPENTPLSFPSNLDISELIGKGLKYLIDQEVELRKGQVNDILGKLRIVLGTRNVLISKVVRNSKSTKTNTRAWKEVNPYTRERNLLVRLYCRSRQALKQLGVEKDLFKTTYQEITANDLKVSGDLTDFNRYGQKNDRLPWFWHLAGKELAEGSVVMNECECDSI